MSHARTRRFPRRCRRSYGLHGSRSQHRRSRLDDTNGFLGGLTQITYGCPGPQLVGQQCERWSVFAQARFVLRRNRANGTPIPTSRRVVVSDRNGRFTLTLTAGNYTISPLAQQHTKGGRSLTARVRAGQTTRIKVRFLGYPMMA